MCGIIGYVGNKKVTDVLINGLKSLEYRGYDSSGVALNENGKIKIIKSVGRVDDLVKKINNTELGKSSLGIGHTRWATHGIVNEINCHPHCLAGITLVHNGIIENYRELKSELEKKGYKFCSETDTEIICALIDSLNNKDIVEALEKAKSKMTGSYALLVMNDEDKLYAIRKNSPLIVGIGENENFVASDISAILKYTNKYVEIDEEDVFCIEKDSVLLYKNGILSELEVKESVWDLEDAQKQGYDHFMLKEIHEQETLADKIANKYLDGNEYTDDIPNLSNYERIDIVACGSAYHASLIGKYLIDKYVTDGSVFVNVDVASEYRYKEHYFSNKSLLVVLSQSGETADTLACLRMAREKNVDTLAIVNVPSSSIAKEAKYVMPMIAGPEIAVATTKGYFSQVLDLSLAIQKLCEEKYMLTNSNKNKLIEELKSLSSKLSSLISNDEYKKIANKIYEHDDLYFIGRGLDYITLLEASLKLKEISYIHSDAYQAGELKHGPIALIEKETPVIALITDEFIKDKTISNAIEAKSRGAKLTLVVSDNIDIDQNLAEDVIRIPHGSDFYQTLYSIIPFQMLAYEVAKLKGCDVDKPKNLAKSVTVE